MKYYLVFITFLFNGLALFSQDVLKFNNYSFGTSFDIIKKNEGSLISLDRDTSSPVEGSYRKNTTDTVASYQATTIYIFNKGNLIAGYYSIMDNSVRSNDFVLYDNAYNDLKNRLTRVYGNPSKVDEAIPIDPLNHKVITTWSIGNDVIELQVFNSNPRNGIANWNFRLYIYYKSKQYIESELLNEKNKKENIDGL